MKWIRISTVMVLLWTAFFLYKAGNTEGFMAWLAFCLGVSYGMISFFLSEERGIRSRKEIEARIKETEEAKKNLHPGSWGECGDCILEHVLIELNWVLKERDPDVHHEYDSRSKMWMDDHGKPIEDPGPLEDMDLRSEIGDPILRSWVHKISSHVDLQNHLKECDEIVRHAGMVVRLIDEGIFVNDFSVEEQEFRIPWDEIEELKRKSDQIWVNFMKIQDSMKLS
ncbi:TPA_asm: hypothetical protein vir519_00014 [Caudoviricetes sp. vir519]|nr:TPA_asm: hypothetical protein vir519_00014 [Caudoviricetes sp. vir519]